MVENSGRGLHPRWMWCREEETAFQHHPPQPVAGGRVGPVGWRAPTQSSDFKLGVGFVPTVSIKTGEVTDAETVESTAVGTNESFLPHVYPKQEGERNQQGWMLVARTQPADYEFPTCEKKQLRWWLNGPRVQTSGFAAYQLSDISQVILSVPQ